VMISLASFTEEVQLKGDINWQEEPILYAKNLHHPLLAPQKSIGNDFVLNKSEKTILLTGSNMSGKTTFMRTVGINMVLVNLGLRPFAEEFICGPFELYTSMRNTDSLGESVSSFYAELARIRQVLEAAENGTSVFYLMDEILKGTNTTDRIMGSEALIRQLSATNAKGIISTHDIELSLLEKSLPYLVNRSFHSKIEDREISFDYKLKSGPCPSFNAHKLMELMGIRFQ
jgi:DNA mismatch repair ATPase MutS